MPARLSWSSLATRAGALIRSPIQTYVYLYTKVNRPTVHEDAMRSCAVRPNRHAAFSCEARYRMPASVQNLRLALMRKAGIMRRTRGRWGLKLPQYSAKSPELLGAKIAKFSKGTRFVMRNSAPENKAQKQLDCRAKDLLEQYGMIGELGAN